MKRYLKLSIIRKLPLFVVLSVLLLTVAFTNANNVDFAPSYSYYYTVNPTVNIVGIVVVFFLIMSSLPFFSMNYRYSLGRSDLYRQVAFKDKRIRYLEHLSTLIIICISFTIAFALMVAILMVRNYVTTEDPSFYLYYSWFILLYFVCLVVGCGLYFISYLLISRSNVFINSLLTFALGYTFINCIAFALVTFCTGDITAGSFFLQGPTPVGSISYVSTIFAELICYDKFTLFTESSEWYTSAAFYTCIVEFIILVGLGIAAFIFEKDPSSEWAGKPDTHRPYQEIIFHAGFGVIGLIIGICMTGSILTTVISLLFYVSYAASYYALYGLLHRNFKLKGYQFGILFGVVGISIISGFVYMLMHQEY